MGATRRRGATLEYALLDAAWEELQESGYAKLTMERVADRAATSRAVIYRRWRNRPELVIAAMRHRRASFLRARLPTPARCAATSLRSCAGPLRGSPISARPPSSGCSATCCLTTRHSSRLSTSSCAAVARRWRAVLDRAAARGEAREHISPRVARLPIDLLRHELILTHQPPSPRSLQGDRRRDLPPADAAHPIADTIPPPRAGHHPRTRRAGSRTSDNSR